MNTTIRLLVVLFLLFLLPVSVYAETRTASSCSVADIQTAVNASTNGDTVKVPGGNCTWTTILTLNKEITLMGAGIGTTNITTGSANGYIVIPNANNNWRISGFSFNAATSGWFAIYAYPRLPRTGWRIDHCAFTGYHYGLYMYGTMTGVIDHNNFYGSGISIFGNNDNEWAAATNLGGSNFVFVEDNRFSDTGSISQILHVMYAAHGARMVFRYNTIIAETSNGLIDGIADACDAHGYCHGSNIRGTRVYEVYQNTFTTGAHENPSRGVFIRSGTGVVYNNTFNTTARQYGFSAISFSDYRIRSAAVGTDTSSCSATCSTSALCYPSYYRLKYTDTVSFSEGQTVTGATSGASATILGVGQASKYLYFLAITSGPFQMGENLQVGGVTRTTAAAASEAQAGEGYPCCDQVGRGINNTSEPYYLWNNVDQNNNPVLPSNSPGTTAGYIVENRDYYNTQKPGYSPYTYPHPLTYPKPPTLLRIN